MPKVVRKDIDNLNAELTVTIEKADYEPTLTSKLGDFRKKAQLKGFRKGKTPMGFIKKMYGQSLLVETVNEQLQQHLADYLKKEDIEILGQPLPSESQGELNFDVNKLSGLVFAFDIGLAPEFEVKGIGSDTTVNRNAVQVADKMINEDMEHARKRMGEPEPIETAIEEKDMVYFDVEELEDGKVKKNGWAATFGVLVDEKMDDDLKTSVLGKKTGHTQTLDITKVEKDRDIDFIRKYYLEVGENDADVVIGNDFNAKISKVTRVKEAELNQEFFDKYFGEGIVKTEEEARKKVEENIVKYYDQQADALLFRDIQENILDANVLELPDSFLKRWLKETNEDVTDDIIEAEFNDFTQNLRWSLIKGKIVKKFDIKISDEDIIEGFKDRIRGYFGGQQVDELIVLNTANRLMDDQNQVNQMYQELVSDKIFVTVKEAVTIEDQKISSEDFDEVILKARQEAMAKSQKAAAPKAIEASDDDVKEIAEDVTEDIEQG